MCQILNKSNNFQCKKASEEKSGQTKKHKFHEVPEIFCSQWQNIESKELKKLKLCKYLIKYFHNVCQKSSKANVFDGKRASEAKSGEAKKHKIHELLNLLYFYSKNLEPREM